MEIIHSWKNIPMQSLEVFFGKLSGVLPDLLGALALLVVGWILARVLSGVTRKVLTRIHFDRSAERLGVVQMLKSSNITRTPTRLAGALIYGIVLFLAFIAAAEVLGWRILSELLAELLVYLPNLLSSLILLLLGIIIARMIRDGVYGAAASVGLSNARPVSAMLYYVLLLLILIAALDQAKIDTSILTGNALIIIGAVLFAFSVAYGWATTDLLGNLCAAFVLGNKFTEGQEIAICGIRGEIDRIGRLYFSVREPGAETVQIFPIKALINCEVEIFHSKDATV